VLDLEALLEPHLRKPEAEIRVVRRSRQLTLEVKEHLGKAQVGDAKILEWFSYDLC
jgi:hypothetical protein